MITFLNLLICVYLADIVLVLSYTFIAYFLGKQVESIEIWQSFKVQPYTFKKKNILIKIGFLPFGSNVKLVENLYDMNVVKRIIFLLPAILVNYLIIILLYSTFVQPILLTKTLIFIFFLLPIGLATIIAFFKIKFKINKEDKNINEGWIVSVIIYIAFSGIFLYQIDKIIPYFESIVSLINWKKNIIELDNVKTIKSFFSVLCVILLIINFFSFLPFYGFRGYNIIIMIYEIMTNRRKEEVKGYIRHLIMIVLFYLLVIWILLGLFLS